MNKTIYVTTKEIEVEAIYWEPIDDGHPDIGSYSRDIWITIPKNSRVFLDENGNLEDVFACGKDITHCYGVSMHPGHTDFTQNLSALIGTDIKIVSEKEWEWIWEVQSSYNEYREEWLHESRICEKIEMAERYDISEMIAEVVTEEDYKKASETLWSSAYNYIDHMKMAMHALGKMQEYKILGAA